MEYKYLVTYLRKDKSETVSCGRVFVSRTTPLNSFEAVIDLEKQMSEEGNKDVTYLVLHFQLLSRR